MFRVMLDLLQEYKDMVDSDKFSNEKFYEMESQFNEELDKYIDRRIKASKPYDPNTDY